MRLSVPHISIMTSDESGKGFQGEFNIQAVGLGLHRTWTYLTIFTATTLFFPTPLMDGGEQTYHLGAFYLITAALLIALLFFAAARTSTARRLLSDRKAVYFATSFCAIGTLLLLASSLFPAVTLPTSVAAGIFCALGNAALILYWGMVFSRFETMTVVVNTAVSIIIAMAIFSLITFAIPTPWNMAVTALLPLLQIPFLRKSIIQPDSLPTGVPQPSHLPMKKGSFAIRLGLPSLLFGFALGTLRGVTTGTVNLNKDPLVFFIALLAASIVTFILLIVFFSVSELNNDEHPVHYIVPILILALLFLPMLAIDHPTVVGPFILASYLSFKAIMWIFFSTTSHQFRISPLYVFGIGFGAMALGSFSETIGAFFHTTIESITPFGNYSLIALSVIAMVIAYVLLPRTAAIQRLAEKDGADSATAAKPAKPRKTQPATHAAAPSEASVLQTPLAHPAVSVAKESNVTAAAPATKSEPQADVFKARCDEICNRYLLSHREAEVLYLLARGHNAAYIQEKLCVAQSTTKTHIYHIYQKLGIHTQQELIALVNEG